MPIPDTDLQAVQLGALLHDAGKLFQRSGLRPSRSYDGFSQGDYGAHGAHAKWTADFVERHVAPRWQVRPHDLLTHHLSIPPSRTARLIALADRLAAGEREEDDDPRGRPAWESQLLSIFSRLGDPSAAPARDGYHALAPLELDRRVISPRSERLSPDECRSGYLRPWQGFERDFSALDRLDSDRYLEVAYHLLRTYCWCVPSAAYRQTPDVSLSRTSCVGLTWGEFAKMIVDAFSSYPSHRGIRAAIKAFMGRRMAAWGPWVPYQAGRNRFCGQ